jgi:hypothetical protein
MKQKTSPARRTRPALKPLPLLLVPFIAVKRLLSAQVRVRRRDGKLQVVFQGDGGATIPPPANEVPAGAPGHMHAADMSEGADCIEADLSELLARHEHSRHFMRYLAYTERALKLGGPGALAQMPVEVLRKTREQLEELVSDWSSPGLAQLRMQLEVLIAEKEENPGQSTLGTSDFHAKAQVEEATVSQFLAAERGWRPGDKQPS